MRLYVCGVTPYDVGHLGHAAVYTTFDTLRRYLEFSSFEVDHIQNITDIDDDMVRKSQELGVSIAELTDQNHEIFLSEMDALSVLRPSAYPRVSETMPEIIEMVQQLIDRDLAYEVDGYVFFESSRAPDFGALSGLSHQQLRDAPRTDMMPEEPDELKRDPLDFLIWQPCSDEGATFDSPWGPGRPGWHIECSAMARANLGDRIDIHGGGRDLVYPHHESEIVQSEGATGQRPFSGWWMHHGLAQLDGEKMSKSLGNLVKVHELLAGGHTPDAIRLFFAGTHYRQDHNFTEAELDEWEQVATALRRAAEGPGGPSDALRVQSYRRDFLDAMDDDLDTPAAITALSSLARAIEEQRVAGETAIPALIELAGVLGLTLGREG